MWVLSPLALFSLVGSASGQAMKIGFVNSQQVLYGTDQGKKGLKELESLMAENRKEFERKNSELSQLQNEYMTNQSKMTREAASSMERRIERKELELKRFREDVQGAVSQKQNELFQSMSGKIQGIIQEVAGKKSLSAIFMRDQTQIYVSPALDVTEEIIRAYNERYPGEGTAAPTGNQ
jgi:Skp family chaperone for outer membrane proteins